MFSGAIKASKGTTGTTPPATNPPFNTVTLLMHADGANGSTNMNFIDSSAAPLTVVNTGTPNNSVNSQTAFNPYKSAYSVDCRSAQSPVITTAANTVLGMGTGNFTIECWLYPYGGAGNGTRAFFDIYEGNTSARLFVQLNDANTISFRFGTNGTSTITTTTVIQPNTWTHIAIVRSSTATGGLSFYINGVADATTGTCATNFTSTTGTVYLCAYGGSSNLAQGYFDGLISQLRVVKGVAVYTGNFTVPTSVLQANQFTNPYGGSNTSAITGTQTSLLTFVRPTYVDSSGNALTLFRGSALSNTSLYPWFVPQIPIPNATVATPATAIAWSSASFSGSYANNLNSSYLGISTTTAFGFASASFTFEAYFYITATNSQRMDLFNFNTNSSSQRVDVYFETGVLNLFANGSGLIAATVAPTQLQGTWAHIACVRNAGTTTLYVNGKSVGSTTTAFALSTTNPWNLGLDSSFLGFVAGYRIQNGAAQYTANFTPPTAPVGTTASTKLLLNFTNGSIIDYSMNQMLIPYSNTITVSTTQSKFGGSSLRLPGGVNSYIFAQIVSAVDNQAILFGSGDFTVEGWFWADAGTSDKGIFQIAFTQTGFGGQTGLALGYYTSNNFRLYYGAASAVTGTASLLLPATWIHFAVVRSGTGASNLKVYINGVADTALTVTDSYTYPSAYLTLGGYNSTANTFTGYLDEIRISKYAVYTSNFVPPTAAFPNL